MEHGNEQARRHARFFGREYSGPIAQDSIVDLEAIDGASRRYQTILAFDPDTRGAGVCVIHDFALPTPDAHASRSAVEVFALKRRDGRDPLIDATDLVFHLDSALSAGTLRQPRRGVGLDTTLDVFVENAHAQGSYVAGRNVGIVYGAVAGWLATQRPHNAHPPARRARDCGVTLVSPNAWIRGLFGENVSKDERVCACRSHAPPEIQAGIAQAGQVDRNRRLAEAIADAWCIALYAMHRAWDEAVASTFPRSPRGLTRLVSEVDNERDARYRELFSTLTRDELPRMLRRGGQSATGDKNERAERARACVTDDGDDGDDEHLRL